MSRNLSRPAGRAAAPALWLALGLWVALGLALGVRTVAFPTRHTVFPIFAASARHWWADQPLYANYAPLDRFRYPPAFAVAVTPLAVLGPCVGGILWAWLSLAVYGAGLWRCTTDVLPGRWSAARQYAFLTLATLVALRGFWNGQSNALAVGLLLLAGAGLARQRWWTAAALLAVAVWLKLTPLAPALLLCALWPRRLGPRLAVTLAVGALVPFLTRPPAVVVSQYTEWLTHLVHSGNSRWPGFRDGWTLWVVARHLWEGKAGMPSLVGKADLSAYRLVQALSAGGALAWCLGQKWRGAEPRWLVCVTLAMGTAWLMLFGPAVEHATYAFLAPALAWAVLERPTWPGGRAPAAAAFVAIGVLGWGSVTRPLLDRFPLLLASLPLGSALFTLWLVAYAATAGPAVRLPVPDEDGPIILPLPRERFRTRAAA